MRHLIAAALLWLMCVPAFGQDTTVPLGQSQAATPYHSNPSLIPATCCVTNDCCWEITASEVKSLPDDNWEVRSTGQVRKRTAYSPDGRYYRCACDYDAASRHWIKHQGANTRCVFVPMQLF
jgi:hypothetical protein